MTEPAAFTPDMRDIETNPYDAQERRVCAYLQTIVPDTGCGNDPIGFLIASHGALWMGLKELMELRRRLELADKAIIDAINDERHFPQERMGLRMARSLLRKALGI